MPPRADATGRQAEIGGPGLPKPVPRTDGDAPRHACGAGGGGRRGREFKGDNPTPWSLNRLFKGMLNSLVDYFGGVFSTDFTPIFLSKSLPSTPK